MSSMRVAILSVVVTIIVLFGVTQLRHAQKYDGPEFDWVTLRSSSGQGYAVKNYKPKTWRDWKWLDKNAKYEEFVGQKVVGGSIVEENK